MRAASGWERGGSGQANKNKEVFQLWRSERMEGRADGCGRETGWARRRCRREWRQALRGAVAEGGNRTEYAFVVIPANREN
jgi:hypothetical protein